MKRKLMTILLSLVAGAAFAEWPDWATPVEYIESSGAQEIQTDYMPYSASTIVADFSMDTAAGTVFGASSGNYCFWLNIRSGDYSLRITSAYEWTLRPVETDVRYQVRVGGKQVRFTNPVTGDAFDYPNTVQLSTKSVGDQNFWLFACAEDYGCCRMKLYGAKIYESGACVRNFQPCVSNFTGDAKVAGLYDVMNNKFYPRYNLKDADFTYGPEKTAATTLKICVTPDRLAPAATLGTVTDLASGTATNLTAAATTTDAFGNAYACTGCRIYEAVYDAASGEMTTGAEIEGSPFEGTSVAYTHGDEQRIAVWQYEARPATPPSTFSHALEFTAPAIDVDGKANDLENVPVLVQLSGDLAEYAYDKMAFPATGADIAFYTMDGALLPHDIDTWVLHGVSTVWVKIPRLRTGEKFQMAYGCNDTTKYVAENPSAVWSDYQGVWHMDAADYVGEDLMIDDETGHGLSAQVRDPAVQTADAAGAVGGAYVSDTARRSTTKKGFVVPNTQALWDAGSFTVSCWLKRPSASSWEGSSPFATMTAVNAKTGGFAFRREDTDSLICFCDKSGSSAIKIGGFNLSETAWYNFTFTFTSNMVNGGVGAFYKRGVYGGGGQSKNYYPAEHDLAIGTWPTDADCISWYGSIDEVRWSKAALTATRIAQDCAMVTNVKYFAVASAGGGPRTVEVTRYVTELGLDLDLPECHVQYSSETNVTFVCSATRDRFYTKDDVAYECTGYTFTPTDGEAFSGSGTSFEFKPSEMGNGDLRWNFTRAGYRARVHNVPKFLEDYASVTVTPLDPEDHLFDVYYKVYAQLTVTLTEKVPGSFTRWYGAEASVVSNKTVTYQVLATADNADLVPEVCGIVNTDDDTRLASDNCARVPATRYVYLKTDGDDANDGLSATAAVASVSRALAVAREGFATNGAQQVVLAGSGAYVAEIAGSRIVEPVVFEGGTSDVAFTVYDKAGSSTADSWWFRLENDRTALRRLTVRSTATTWGAGKCGTVGVLAGTLEGVTVTNCFTGTDCDANYKGVVGLSGTGVITNCLIVACHALDNWRDHLTQGAVRMTGGLLASTRITGCTSSAAQYGYGGGVYMTGGTLRNCLIDNCRAYTQGSGLYIDPAASCTVENCTVVDGAPVSGSSASPCGVYMTGSSATKNVVFVNNIVWGNSGNGEGEKDLCNLCRANATHTYLANNLFNTELEEDETTVDNVAGNPSFTDRAGGDYTIGRGAARNAGRTLAWAQDPLAVDLAGRVRIQESVLDIGCYEHVPSTELGVTATVTVPENFKAGDLVSLAAEASGGAGDYTYAWYFGSTLVATGKNAETNVACTVYGRSDVTCVVTDADGKTAECVEEGAIRLYVSKVYVAKGGSNTAPYDTWEKAADDFVAPMAILDSSKLSEVVVGPGAYDVTNRIDFVQRVNFHSSGGAAATVLRPAADVSLFACEGAGEESVVEGFTIEGMSGNAIAIDSYKTWYVTNLVFRACTVGSAAFIRMNAAASALKASGITLDGVTNTSGYLVYEASGSGDRFDRWRIDRCKSSNTAINIGKSSFRMYNSLITRTTTGGHLVCTRSAWLVNVTADDCVCTVWWGYPFDGGGIGVSGGDPHYYRNCIFGRFWSDEARTTAHDVFANNGGKLYNCCSWQDYGQAVTNGLCFNATNPKFRRADYRLRGSSPCLRAGDPQPYGAASVDLDGRQRLHATSAGYTVDMGCYENDVPGFLLLVK